MTGKVFIVGAGPGRADLLTVRAAETLRAAQVVLHDDLVSREVLELCSPEAQIVNVGKRCGQHGSSQEQIDGLMIAHAQARQVVVRLKSGDPSVFGRLGEELDVLREAGIPFEIIPGVTAAAAAAAAAEITLTDRRLASTLVVLAGHRMRDETKFPRFNAERTTFAVYMPGPDYARTVRELVASGIDAATPCALVSHAGRSTQQVRFMSLESLGSMGFAAIPPSVLIVGEVARRDEFREILRMLGNQEESQLRNDPFEASESRGQTHIA